MARLPPILYGTAWKKDKTRELVIQAIQHGFRGIDTACQPKHYHEPGVGEAIQHMIASGKVKRGELFIQTKFTSVNGQDPSSIPYDKDLSLREQVLQSFEVSCRNLHTDYIDSLVLHSPMRTLEETLEVWRAFEELHFLRKVHVLGISNIYNLHTLQELFAAAVIKPSIIQNRFYRDTHYDQEIRAFCRNNDIVYQSFWTLTGNPSILNSRLLRDLAAKYSKTKEQVFFNFVHDLGIVPLSGTKSTVHMTEDLDAVGTVFLSAEEVAHIEHLLRNA